MRKPQEENVQKQIEYLELNLKSDFMHMKKETVEDATKFLFKIAITMEAKVDSFAGATLRMFCGRFLAGGFLGIFHGREELREILVIHSGGGFIHQMFRL